MGMGQTDDKKALNIGLAMVMSLTQVHSEFAYFLKFCQFALV